MWRPVFGRLQRVDWIRQLTLDMSSMSQKGREVPYLLLWVLEEAVQLSAAAVRQGRAEDLFMSPSYELHGLSHDGLVAYIS
jgi:hypothetical protein